MPDRRFRIEADIDGFWRALHLLRFDPSRHFRHFQIMAQAPCSKGWMTYCLAQDMNKAQSSSAYSQVDFLFLSFR